MRIYIYIYIYIRPKRLPRGPKRAPRGVPRGPQKAKNRCFSCVFCWFLAFSHFRASNAPRRPKRPPRPRQDRRRAPQDGPKTGQEGLRTAQEAPRTAPYHPGTGRRWAQEREQEAPRDLGEASRTPQRPPRDPREAREASRERLKRPKSFIFFGFFDVFGLLTIPCFQRSKTAEEPRAPQEAPGYPQDDTKNRREPSHQTARLFQGDFWLTAPAKQFEKKGFSRIPFFFKLAPCLHSHDSPHIKPPSPLRKDATKPSMATHQRKRKGN